MPMRDSRGRFTKAPPAPQPDRAGSSIAFWALVAIVFSVLLAATYYAIGRIR